MVLPRVRRGGEGGVAGDRRARAATPPQRDEADEVAGQANDILISAASAWEITTKARLGNSRGRPRSRADVAGALAGRGFAALEISVLHAQRADNLPGDHRDPFDRMVIAQAQFEDVPVVSNDPVFDVYGVTVSGDRGYELN